MSKKIILVLTAHNNRSQHSYVVGVYENANDAAQAAETESLNRAMKYRMQINPFHLNKMPENLVDIEDNE